MFCVFNDNLSWSLEISVQNFSSFYSVILPSSGFRKVISLRFKKIGWKSYWDNLRWTNLLFPKCCTS